MSITVVTLDTEDDNPDWQPCVPATTSACISIAAPRNTAPPAITGTPRVGSTLTCEPGTWTGSTGLAYRWLKSGTEIPGATAPTYVVRADDVYNSLTCEVTATGPGGTTTAASAAASVNAEPVHAAGRAGVLPDGAGAGKPAASRGLGRRLRERHRPALDPRLRVAPRLLDPPARPPRRARRARRDPRSGPQGADRHEAPQRRDRAEGPAEGPLDDPRRRHDEQAHPEAHPHLPHLRAKAQAPESPMIRITMFAVVAALLTSSPAAYAASGTLTDPKGDYPDIVKLGYVNAKSKVTLTMTVAGGHAQNESFYLRWGSKGASYQVFSSPSAKLKELRYYSRQRPRRSGSPAPGWSSSRHRRRPPRCTVPRTLPSKAPDALRFQGIATEGTSLLDETKVSGAVKRG